jgi:NDP-sugar pyrophosphorylase family protein
MGGAREDVRRLVQGWHYRESSAAAQRRAASRQAANCASRLDSLRGEIQHSAAMFAPETLLDLDRTDHRKLFENVTCVWEALKQISSYLQFRLKPGIHGRLIGKPFISGAVFVGQNTTIEHGAMIKGPAWIGEGSEIRNGCYIRENVIVGNGVVLGNSCEFKNSIIFDEAQVPHFNYVGDSIIGFKGHLGAGVILSNVKLDHSEVTVATKSGLIPTGLKKFGAVIGDHAEIGCNSVLSPGSIIGRQTIMYPGTQWRGVVPEGSIVKFKQGTEVVARRDL